jgi:ATP synthase mitochondrial F1 complex assembly factor 2
MRSLSSSVNATSAGVVKIGGLKAKGSRRFYENVDIHEMASPSTCSNWFGVLLDGKLVQTPQERPLLVPTRALASGIACEWAMQHDKVLPSSMLLTTLATTAIDQFSKIEPSENDKAKQYLAFDVICFRDEQDAKLARRQRKAWDPVLDWIEDACKHRLAVSNGIGSSLEHQERASNAVDAVFNQLVSPLDPWRRAAVATAAGDCRSYSLALALVLGPWSPKKVIEASRIDEEYQIEEWGCVEGGHDIDKAYLQARLSAVQTFIYMLDTASLN